MDLDVLEKNARAVLGFKGELDAAMPQIRKTIADMVTVADDIAKIKETLAPALEWIAGQQKAIDAAKAVEDQKAAEAAKAQREAEADRAAKAAAEKPPETPAADPAKPLEHIAEVEASLDAGAEPAARSESETDVG